jgi:hypothetical protein
MTVAIDNERTKLSANALDRSSTACLAVGIFAPLAGLFQGQMHISLPAMVSIAGWFAAAVVLHYAARHVLGGPTQ